MHFKYSGSSVFGTDDKESPADFCGLQYAQKRRIMSSSSQEKQKLSHNHRLVEL